jgi:hypothetical protein
MIDKVKPYMEKLVDILCKQCKLDSDHVRDTKKREEKME